MRHRKLHEGTRWKGFRKRRNAERRQLRRVDALPQDPLWEWMRDAASVAGA